MAWFIVALGLVSFLICLPLCVVVLRWSWRWGLLDRAGSEAHKPALSAGRKPVANTGGVAIFAAIAWPMLGVLIGVWAVPLSWWSWLAPPVVPHLAGLRATTAVGGGLLAGLAVMHVVGLFDDRRALGPYLKLAVQVGVAAGLVLVADARVFSFLANPDLGYGWPGFALMFALSLAWIVVVTNAMNFLDNMDGLAAGVGLVAGLIYLAATLLAGQWFVAALAALLCGALGGFLLFNLPPARLYMGDGGSLVVGLMLAVIAVRTTYVVVPPQSAGQLELAVGPRLGGLLVPVVVLAIPLYDFTSVTLIRLLRGQSPLQGDNNHFSHRLQRTGLGKGGTLTVILLATLATGLGGVMLGGLEGWQACLVAVQVVAVLAMIAVLEFYGSQR